MESTLTIFLVLAGLISFSLIFSFIGEKCFKNKQNLGEGKENEDQTLE